MRAYSPPSPTSHIRKAFGLKWGFCFLFFRTSSAGVFPCEGRGTRSVGPFAGMVTRREFRYEKSARKVMEVRKEGHGGSTGRFYDFMHDA